MIAACSPRASAQWEAFDEEDARRSLETAFEAAGRAGELSAAATDTEKALIGALRSRYPSSVPAVDMCPWNDDYAAAMRAVHREHGDDADVEALFAEAIMNRTPWALWDLKTGTVAEGAETAEAIAVLEKAMRRRRDRDEQPHAGLLHMYINRCVDILAVAREMMLGELAYRRGDHEAAFAHLRRSVELDDNLPHDEPWGWMQPTRHALAALLLEQDRVEEATAVYRADLGYDDTLSRACQHPDNVWSLHGYHECMERLGRHAEAAIIRQRLQVAMARTDVPVTASCFCRLHAQ